MYLRIDGGRFHFFDHLRLWLNHPEPPEPVPDESLDNTITLSEAFYREIDAHRIPVEREVVAALAHAPGALDFYVWIVWKSWVVNGRPAYIPILSSGGLSEQLGCKSYAVDRTFRHVLSTAPNLAERAGSHTLVPSTDLGEVSGETLFRFARMEYSGST
jgi:hypothetical protein